MNIIVKGELYRFNLDPNLPKTAERADNSGKLVRITGHVPVLSTQVTYMDAEVELTGEYLRVSHSELSPMPSTSSVKTTARITTSNRDVSWDENGTVVMLSMHRVQADTGSIRVYYVEMASGDRRFYFENELVFDV